MTLLPSARAKCEGKPIFRILQGTDAALSHGVLIRTPKLYQMPPTVKLLVFAPLEPHIQNGCGVLASLGLQPQTQKSDTFNYV